MPNRNRTVYYLGIDGGGTKTHAVIMDDAQNIVYEGFSGSSSIDTVTFQESIQQVIRAVEPAAIPEIAFVFAGIGGIAKESDSAYYRTLLSRIPGFPDVGSIEVHNDVYGALASGKGTLEGMALILGTGSVCFGIHKGKHWRCGGYHYREGDAGSAFDIGFQALKHFARVVDGRKPHDLLAQEISEALGIEAFADLVQFFDRATRTEMAKIAQVVTRIADQDPVARDILLHASEEVALMVDGVSRNLDFPDADLVVIGGIGTADTPYKTYYTQAIHRLQPRIRIIKPQYTPGVACALIARQRAHATPAGE